MDSIRQQQVASLVQQNMGDIFIKHGRSYYGGAFVTITAVRVTPDLAIARIYLSIFNVEDKQEVVDLMTKQTQTIRRQLGNRLRNKVRRIPELEFYLDASLDEVFKMEKLFDELKKERKEEEL